MPGPMAKHPSARARRNKVSTHAILQVVPNQKVPPLPSRSGAWSAGAKSYWKALWLSPQRQQFVDGFDELNLARVLRLYESALKCFDEGDFRLMVTLEAELRQQLSQYGMDPRSLRTLQWQIEQAEAAEEKTTARRRKRAAEAGPRPVEDDPRAMLG